MDLSDRHTVMQLELNELFATQVVRTRLDTPAIDPARLCRIILDLRERHPVMGDYRQGVTQANTWHSIIAGLDALLAYEEFRSLLRVFCRLVEETLNLIVEQH